MTADNVLKALLESEDGRLFLGKLRLCVRAKLYPPDAEKALLAHVAVLSVASKDVLDAARNGLAKVVPSNLEADLQKKFAGAWPGGFDAMRILSEETYNVYYAETPSDVSSDGGVSSGVGRDRLEREIEFMAPFHATPIAVLDAPRPVKSFILLGSPGTKAYIAHAGDWTNRIAATSSLADATADWLGYPATPGTAFVALMIRHDTPLGWGTCRRPTLLDAVNHSWWYCWPEDSHDLGHTICIARMDEGALERGGKEWVVDPVDIDTSNDRVTARNLGKTTFDTVPAGRPDAWRHFVAQVAVRN